MAETDVSVVVAADKADGAVPVHQQAGLVAGRTGQSDESSDASTEWELTAEPAWLAVCSHQPPYPRPSTQQALRGMHTQGHYL